MLTALRGGHWPSLMGAWLHFEVSFMTWLLIGALGVSIAEEFALSPAQKGLLVAVPLLGGALLRVAVGFLSDRFGAKRTGLALLGGELIAVIMGWLGAGGYGQILTVGLLLGIAGASFAVALPIASRAYPPVHQGLAMGVAASANSGTVLAMLCAPRLAELVGWRGVFGTMIVPILLTLILFAALVRNDPMPLSRIECREDCWAPMRELLRRPSSYWLCFVYAVTFGGFVGFCSVLPIFLHDQYGLNPVVAGSATALCGLIGSVIRPLGGYVADRKGGLRVLRVTFLLIAGFVAAVGTLPVVSWALLLFVLAVAGMGFGNGAVFQVVSDRFPKQIGMASGLIGAAGGLGGFLLPVWLGSLKEATGSFQPGLWLFAVLAGGAAVSVTEVMKRQRTTVQP